MFSTSDKLSLVLEETGLDSLDAGLTETVNASWRAVLT